MGMVQYWQNLAQTNNGGLGMAAQLTALLPGPTVAAGDEAE